MNFWLESAGVVGVPAATKKKSEDRRYHPFNLFCATIWINLLDPLGSLLFFWMRAPLPSSEIVVKSAEKEREREDTATNDRGRPSDDGGGSEAGRIWRIGKNYVNVKQFYILVCSGWHGFARKEDTFGDSAISKILERRLFVQLVPKILLEIFYFEIFLTFLSFLLSLTRLISKIYDTLWQCHKSKKYYLEFRSRNLGSTVFLGFFSSSSVFCCSSPPRGSDNVVKMSRESEKMLQNILQLHFYCSLFLRLQLAFHNKLVPAAWPNQLDSINSLLGLFISLDLSRRQNVQWKFLQTIRVFCCMFEPSVSWGSVHYCCDE